MMQAFVQSTKYNIIFKVEFNFTLVTYTLYTEPKKSDESVEDASLVVLADKQSACDSVRDKCLKAFSSSGTYCCDFYNNLGIGFLILTFSFQISGFFDFQFWANSPIFCIL